jgi:hypothetical protein
MKFVTPLCDRAWSGGPRGPNPERLSPVGLTHATGAELHVGVSCRRSDNRDVLGGEAHP